MGNPTTGYSQGPHCQGKFPFWPDALLQKIICRAALRAGINKQIGWRTFRHTFSTVLIANGENVKVVQELMRHASSRCTREVYSQARILMKRQAQQRLVQMIIPKESDAPEPVLACESQINVL
jgi:integrase